MAHETNLAACTPSGTIRDALVELMACSTLFQEGWFHPPKPTAHRVGTESRHQVLQWKSLADNNRNHILTEGTEGH